MRGNIRRVFFGLPAGATTRRLRRRARVRRFDFSIRIAATLAHYPKLQKSDSQRYLEHLVCITGFFSTASLPLFPCRFSQTPCAQPINFKVPETLRMSTSAVAAHKNAHFQAFLQIPDNARHAGSSGMALPMSLVRTKIARTVGRGRAEAASVISHPTNGATEKPGYRRAAREHVK